MTSIQHFDFDGNKFPVVQADELPSGYGVAVATVCDHLGIATQKQQDRIERSPWSKGRTTIMVVRLPDTDRSRGYFLLDSDRFAMWMATVDTSRLKNPDARDRIERWQNEAADALNSFLRTGVAISKDSKKFSDEQIRAEVERQLEIRNYRDIIRETIKSMGGNEALYAEIRNLFLKAVCGMTAEELINSGRPIRTWKGKNGPTKNDYRVGTNYLEPHELRNFNDLIDYSAIEIRRNPPRSRKDLLDIGSRSYQRFMMFKEDE